MNDTWLIIDTPYLVYRTQFAMRTANPLIGFIQSIKQLNDRFDTDQFIFCFDYGRLKREDLLPGYKDRSDVDDSMKEMRIEAKTQIEVLRRSLLTKWGFANQFCQRGYEADDIMASVVLNNFQDPEREAVIVSADHDLYQLLQDNVLVYDPNQKKLTSAETFRRQWNIEPEQWPYVKAIAGCTSDKVPGLWRMKSLYSTWAISAMPIGAPGCPELARCTASMANARIAFASILRDAIDRPHGLIIFYKQLINKTLFQISRIEPGARAGRFRDGDTRALSTRRDILS